MIYLPIDQAQTVLKHLRGYAEDFGDQLPPGELTVLHAVIAALSNSLGSTAPAQTIAEQLDAAQNGQEFGNVIQGLFATLENAKDDE